MSRIEDPAALKEFLLSPSDSIRRAMAAINAASPQCGLVVDGQGRLVGSLTDGDVRRGLLAGVQLDEPVERVMFKTPLAAPQAISQDQARVLMRGRQVKFLPLLDEERRVVGLATLESLEDRRQENLVVLMAGGLGTRLRPLTDSCPKPLLQIGGKPILEIILEGFAAHGFHRFAIAVNYKAEMIESHFGNGSNWGVEISYLREPRRLGTAGALSLLPKQERLPLLVMNGDLLTKIHYGYLMDFHAELGGKATICVREYDVKVPFGVVEIKDHRLTALHEKPVQKFFVNAGIYVLEPEVLSLIPPGEQYDMTTLFAELLEKGERPAVFPVREYWLDIGQMGDYLRATGEYGELLGSGAND